MSVALYNEHDPNAAEWLFNLAKAGHVAPGQIDCRDIQRLRPKDLDGFTQAHFFAGIGGWSYALRLAGWPDDARVWTGSCPCQPFSQAGKRGGEQDPRHLWPDWFRLIEKCRPPIVFGEQVASRDGIRWLDLVSSDLEGGGYAFGAAVLPAASVGAPHGRHRIFFVADADRTGRGVKRRPGLCADRDETHGHNPHGRSASGGMGDAGSQGLEERERDGRVQCEALGTHPGQGAVGTGDSFWTFWTACDWIPCQDGKTRPVEPGSFPLANGAPGRVGRLRAYGNAIVPQVAARFIRAFMDARPTAAVADCNTRHNPKQSKST